MTTLKHMK